MVVGLFFQGDRLIDGVVGGVVQHIGPIAPQDVFETFEQADFLLGLKIVGQSIPFEKKQTFFFVFDLIFA